MPALFLYGSLCYAPLLKLVLGRDSGAKTVDATLADHAVYWARDNTFPMIIGEAGAEAEGVVVRGLSETDVARLDFYEGGFSYQRLPCRPVTSNGPVDATVYFPEPGHWQPGAPWSLDDWVGDRSAIALRAAEEVMGQFGHAPASDVARFRVQMEVRAASWLTAQAAEPQQGVRNGFTEADVAVAQARRPYARYFSLVEHDLQFRNFDGSMSKPVSLAGFMSGDAVTVLPYDPARDRVMVVEQFRFGPFVRGDRAPWSWEPIAGRIDPGEAPEDCAFREAQEEAGLTLQKLVPTSRYYPSPGAVSEYIFSYVGIADLPDEAAGIGGHADESENIRGILLSFDDLMGLLASGEAENGPLILTALWLQANRAELRSGA